MTTNSTARKPQASDTAAKRQDGTLSKSPFPKPERGARIADAAQIETLDEYSRGECLTGQYIQEVNV